MGTRRPNGQGYTYKNGASYRTVLKSNGLIITASGKTVQESRRNAKTKHLERSSNTFKSGKQSTLTLEEFLTSWLYNEHRNHIAHGTYMRYEGLARVHINPRIGRCRIVDLSPKVITELLASMREASQSARSMQQARTLLSLCLRAAQDLDIIQDNPVLKVRNPKNSGQTFDPLTIAEVKSMLDRFAGTPMGARLHLALLCGLRQGEALGLTWDDVDFDEGLLRVHRQLKYVSGIPQFAQLKTLRSRRTIALPQETQDILGMHRELLLEKHATDWNRNNLVFPSVNGNFKSPKTDYKDWQKALKTCGLTPRRLHDARHTAATLMYSQSVGIETISRALGHSSSAITSRLYVHNADEPLRKAADALGALLRA
jgi:integrase